MVDRNKEAIKKVRESQADQLAQKRVILRYKNDYIGNLVNGRYFQERCNMIAEQINSGKILETVDGAPKPKDYLIAEYNLTKIRAITALRNANGIKRDLLERLKLDPKEIEELHDYYFVQPIMRESYGEENEINPGKPEFE